MEMDVLAADPYITAEQAENHGVELVEIARAARTVRRDHRPRPNEPCDEEPIGREALARMKPGAILLNVARGGVIDEAAVSDALRDGKLAAPGSTSSSRSRQPTRHCSAPRMRC
jgi:D-3-phosphoglycerate dehydrogenase